MKSAALALVFALLAPLAGCASLKPEILCNPYTGQASVVPRRMPSSRARV